MIEILAQIQAPTFTAGIVLDDRDGVERVRVAAPIVKYMRGWSRHRVREYVAQKEWAITVVHRLERPRP